MKQHFFKKNLFLGGFCSLFLGSSMVAPRDFGRYICSFMPNYRVDLKIMAEKETYCLFDDYEKHPGNYSLDPIREVKHDEEKVFYTPLEYMGEEEYVYNEDHCSRFEAESEHKEYFAKLRKECADERYKIKLDFKNRPYYYVNEDFFYDMYNHGIMHIPFILNHIFLKLLGSIWDNQELQGHFQHVMKTEKSNGEQASILRDVFKKTLSQKEYDFLINNYFFQDCDGFKKIFENEGLSHYKRDKTIEQNIADFCKNTIIPDEGNREINPTEEEIKNSKIDGYSALMKRWSICVVDDVHDPIMLSHLFLAKDIKDNNVFARYRMGGDMTESNLKGNIIAFPMEYTYIYNEHQYFPHNDYRDFYDCDLQSTMKSMVRVSKKYHYEKASGEKYNEVKKILKDHFIVIEESNLNKKKELFQNFSKAFVKKFIDPFGTDVEDDFMEMLSQSESPIDISLWFSNFFITMLGILLELQENDYSKWKWGYFMGHIECHLNYFSSEEDCYIDLNEVIFCIHNIWQNNIAPYLKETSVKVKNQKKQLKYFVQLKESLLHQGSIANYPYKGFTTNMSSLNIWDYLIDDFEDIYKIITFYKNKYSQYDEDNEESMNFLGDSIFMDLRSAFIPFFNNEIIDNRVNKIYRSLALDIIQVIKIEKILEQVMQNNPSLYIMGSNIFNKTNSMGEIKGQEIEEIDLIGAEDVIQRGKKGKDIQEMMEDMSEEVEKCKEEYMPWMTESMMEEAKDEEMEEERKEGEQKVIKVKPDTEIEQIVEKVLQNEHRVFLGEKVIPGKVRK